MRIFDKQKTEAKVKSLMVKTQRFLLYRFFFFNTSQVHLYFFNTISKGSHHFIYITHNYYFPPIRIVYNWIFKLYFLPIANNFLFFTLILHIFYPSFSLCLCPLINLILLQSTTLYLCETLWWFESSSSPG